MAHYYIERGGNREHRFKAVEYDPDLVKLSVELLFMRLGGQCSVNSRGESMDEGDEGGLKVEGTQLIYGREVSGAKSPRLGEGQ